MHTKSKSQLMRDAHALYMSGHYTQQEIANRVGITRRTLYNWMQQGNWQRARQTSIVAPAIITENFISAIIELQTAIAQRPVGLRYPTPQETITLSKLLTCITRMSAFPAEALQQAALSQHNHADPANLSPQTNFIAAFAPYNTNVQMGNSPAQKSDNQSVESHSQVENKEQLEPDFNNAEWIDDDLIDEPAEAIGLSPDERKMELTRWLISTDLCPIGNQKVASADGRINRPLNEMEIEFIESYGYTIDDISEVLACNFRA